MHTAVIVGCGRMGSGRDRTSPIKNYTHIEAYLALSKKVSVVAFVDRILGRAEQAAEIWKVPFASDNLALTLQETQATIVSVCTPSCDQEEVIALCESSESVKGIWCEKPFALTRVPRIPTQVNYVRRFETRHLEIRARRLKHPTSAILVVIAALERHTIPHFTNLALWWNTKLRFVDVFGPSVYILFEEERRAGRYHGWSKEVFLDGGGLTTGFMERGLDNLLKTVEGREKLLSPPEDAIRSEVWALRLLAQYGSVERRAASLVSEIPDGRDAAPVPYGGAPRSPNVSLEDLVGHEGH